MERRQAALVGLILALAAACGGPPSASLATGQPVPPEWRPQHSAGRTAVIWVFRTEDCLTCQAFDYSLRRLQRAHAGEVALVAVHVGHRRDAEIPRAFFASRRLELAATAEIPPRRFRRRYGDAPLPALLLARGDTIVWSSASPGQPRLTLAGIDSLFSDQLARDREIQ